MLFNSTSIRPINISYHVRLAGFFPPVRQLLLHPLVLGVDCVQLTLDALQLDVNQADKRLCSVDQGEPGPVVEVQLFPHVHLHDGNHVGLVDQPLVLHPAKVTPGEALEVVEDGLDALIPRLLHTSHGARPEEDLRLANSPFVVHGWD